MPGKRKKTFIALLFCCFFLLLTVGSTGIIYVLRFQIKSSMRSMIKTIPQNELVPIKQVYHSGDENEDEILVHGEFYDIASYEIQGDSIVYYCFYDKAETNLSFLSSHLNVLNDVKSKRNQLSNLFKISELKYLCSALSLNYWFQYLSIDYYFLDENLPSNAPEFPTPPPEFV